MALLIICSWILFSATAFASESSEIKRVLILYSFRYGLSANALMDGNMVTNTAIQTTMEKELVEMVAFHSERMDVSALPENRYFEELRDTYRKKYAGQPLDLIIAVNFRALDFLDKHAEDLWPKIPILFCGVEEGRRKQLKHLRSNITGIFANARFGDMLDTVFRIHPDTQQVMVIVGSSKTDRFIENRVRQLYGKFADRADFTYLSDSSFDAILSKVADLPPDSIVMFLTLLEDGEGKTVPENALHLISRAANAPVYGLFDVYVGHGIVGGTVYSVEDRGNRIGQMGVRILAGEKARDIPFETGQKHFNLYDWQQLQRWGIAENDLPPGSIVRYRNLTFYGTYKWYIWGGILLILFEALMIIHLLLNRSRRLRAERKVHRAHNELGEVVTELKAANVELKTEITERKQTEKALKDSEHRLKDVMVSRALLQNEVKHLDRVATMGSLTAAIAHEINQPLGAILSNAQAAIRFLKAEQADIHHVREALDDIVSNDKRAAEVIRRLRNMLKKADLKRETLKLNSDIREVVDLLQSEMIINNASIKIDLEKELPAVSGDRIQVQQVILNLLVNALEAVKGHPEKNREIHISTTFELPDKILVSVSDSGPGIEVHEIESVFEAFYTTKKSGMGMGLPISKSIIEQHDGHIWASNNSEGGAVFAFSLPLSKHDKNDDN